MNALVKKSLLVVIIPALLGGCAKHGELSNAELLRNAYLDVIEATEKKIRPLVDLIKDDENVIWNSTNDKVLLFTFHRYPDSYPDGQEITFTWGESWLCSVK